MNNIHTCIPASAQIVHAALVHISHFFCSFLTASAHRISWSIGIYTTFIKTLNYLQNTYKINCTQLPHNFWHKIYNWQCSIQTQNDEKKYHFGGSRDWRHVLQTHLYLYHSLEEFWGMLIMLKLMLLLQLH